MQGGRGKDRGEKIEERAQRRTLKRHKKGTKYQDIRHKLG